MAEISDLEPHPAALTPGQVSLYLKAVNAERPCEACGAVDFEMWPEKDGATGLARGLVSLACRQCNALRTFLRPPVITWLRSARLG